MSNKKTPATKKTLAKVESKTLAKPTGAINILDDAGSNQFSREDLSIPRLTILQQLSPQVIKSKTEFINGAEVGMIFDTVSQSVFNGETGINVIPCAFRRAFIEWWPRDSKKGKGFVADHGNDESVLKDCTKNDRGQMITKKGTQIITSGEYYLFLINDDGSYAPYMLTMTSTQLRKSRQWNTMMNTLMVDNPNGNGKVNPAMFYRSYNLSTVPEQNEQGAWFGYRIKPGANTLDLEGGTDIYVAAREFRKSVVEGRVQTTPATPDQHTETGGDDGSPM